MSCLVLGLGIVFCILRKLLCCFGHVEYVDSGLSLVLCFVMIRCVLVGGDGLMRQGDIRYGAAPNSG